MIWKRGFDVLSNPEEQPENRPECVCTTPWNTRVKNQVWLEQVTAWFHGREVARRNRSIAQLMDEEDTSVVVVADVAPKLYHQSNPDRPLFFHPGMAYQRLALLNSGGKERLVTAAQVQPGDTVIDATLGLGADSLVLAHAVGQQGRVIAIEAAFLLAQLFLFEKHNPAGNYPWLSPLFGRIEVRVASHERILAAMPSNSVDVVVFDPMFRRPPDRESSLDPARQFAIPEPLTERAWREAQRVARRTVVLKERPGSGEFARFLLSPDKPRGRFAYGVWQKT